MPHGTLFSSFVLRAAGRLFSFSPPTFSWDFRARVATLVRPRYQDNEVTRLDGSFLMICMLSTVTLPTLHSCPLS